MSDPHYEKAAALTYERSLAIAAYCRQAQAEYGRWLISTLVLLHAGAIAGLLSRASSSPSPPSYVGALWVFVVGIILALAAGLAAWVNFSTAANLFDRWADVRMLRDPQHWPKEPESAAMKVTMWLSLIFGCSSALLILVGAGAVWCSWR